MAPGTSWSAASVKDDHQQRAAPAGALLLGLPKQASAGRTGDGSRRPEGVTASNAGRVLSLQDRRNPRDRNGDQTQPGPGRLLARRRLAPRPHGAVVARHWTRPAWDGADRESAPVCLIGLSRRWARAAVGLPAQRRAVKAWNGMLPTETAASWWRLGISGGGVAALQGPAMPPQDMRFDCGSPFLTIAGQGVGMGTCSSARARGRASPFTLGLCGSARQLSSRARCDAGTIARAFCLDALRPQTGSA